MSNNKAGKKLPDRDILVKNLYNSQAIKVTENTNRVIL